MTTAGGPLTGIRVLDLSRALAGPYCTALLADLGASIIKVESLNGGDTSRQWPPFENDHSLYFDSLNRSKRSVCIDFYSAEGRDILDRLIAGADVLVENFKLGTLEKLGLTAEHLKELNPELVVGSVTGFGTAGPLKNDAGLDQVIQGMSGLMSVTGEKDQNYRVGVPIVDITSGMVCALGIVAALVGRGSGHPVSTVSTSLLETALNLSVFQGQRALSLGIAPAAQGNNHPTIAPYGTFRTATEPLNIAVGTQKQWLAFCGIIGLPAAPEDARFVTGADRSVHRDHLMALVEGALAGRSADEWARLLARAGIPCGPLFDYTQAFGSAQVEALGLVVQTERRDGTALPLVRGPLSFDGQASGIASVPPLLGEHTADVLGEYGYSGEEIARLATEGRVTIHEETTIGAR
ncbi:CaiB/BaiF CoA transferase family protein [Subtercola boreus]|uniref:CoA transferase n=1 Tax=Subtercola boreus TaxID=120213 RepID=A0A3E0W9A9_9MICO|nr:CaiB/BaiF CoA-transferase family protein [Subtercola boreus]RFA18826.1 CoA transferase [Subtercola boreus]RFA18940.1 CoA transferase [Subtercola boreus]RFA25478.1 CoA transferase [Subtercola boreus]